MTVSAAPDLAENMRQEMLLIKGLDENACLRFSEITGGWYISADISITDGKILHGASYEHTGTPWEATQGFLQMLQEVDSATQRIRTGSWGQERYWAWNGATWREIAPDRRWP